MRYSVSDLTEIIRDRRTIKPPQYSEREVQKDLLEQILVNGTWAPTHGMTQPWRFKVFMGGSRARLAEFLAEEYKASTAEDRFIAAKYEKLKKTPMQSSVAVVVYMSRQEEERITEFDELMAVGCCIQNMYLTCTAHGLGGFWSTPRLMHNVGMKQFLGIGEKDRCCGVFYIGYPKGEWPKSYRKPLPELIEYVK